MLVRTALETHFCASPVLQKTVGGLFETVIFERDGGRAGLRGILPAFYKGLVSGRFEIVFPWQMGIVMKTLRLLPAPLAFAITKNMIPEDKEAGA